MRIAAISFERQKREYKKWPHKPIRSVARSIRRRLSHGSDGLQRLRSANRTPACTFRIIDDAYTGLTVIDGQPTMGEAGLRNILRIRTNIQSLGSWNWVRSVFCSVESQTVMAHTMEAAIVLLAALVCWRCVPRAPDLGRRAIYLAVFVVLMMAIGYFMIDAAVVLVTLLFGL